MKPINHQSGLRGRHETATYHNTGVNRYMHNPLIEAMPKILEESEVMQQLRKFPMYDSAERTLSVETRLQFIQTLRDVFVPLPTATKLARKFSSMIRNGYVSRNPLARGHWPNLDAKIEACVTGAASQRSAQFNAPGMAICGIPGAGKSASVENILNLYRIRLTSHIR